MRFARLEIEPGVPCVPPPGALPRGVLIAAFRSMHPRVAARSPMSGS
jgi:hypothetical protein